MIERIPPYATSCGRRSRGYRDRTGRTPLTETVCGLLTGTPIGGNAIGAVAWSLGIASYLWARHLYDHRHAR
ncbi:MAG TPA: hypothetical protein VK778_16135 [Solirubrobacteraceae bacterium]|nr:hypothetical protein [Solirubrobacteraceae bacterium]